MVSPHLRLAFSSFKILPCTLWFVLKWIFSMISTVHGMTLFSVGALLLLQLFQIPGQFFQTNQNAIFSLVAIGKACFLLVLRRKTKKRTAACADQRQEATNVCDFRRFLYLRYTVKIRVVQRGVVEVTLVFLLNVPYFSYHTQ